MVTILVRRQPQSPSPYRVNRRPLHCTPRKTGHLLASCRDAYVTPGILSSSFPPFSWCNRPNHHFSESFSPGFSSSRPKSTSSGPWSTSSSRSTGKRWASAWNLPKFSGKCLLPVTLSEARNVLAVFWLPLRFCLRHVGQPQGTLTNFSWLKLVPNIHDLLCPIQFVPALGIQ